VSLGKNLLTGPIPSELGHLSDSLVHLSLEENDLTDTLPSELGHLTFLRSLRLSGNQNILGAIPRHYANMVEMRLMLLNSTQVIGGIPEELCNELLSLRDNDFTIRVDCVRVRCGCCESC